MNRMILAQSGQILKSCLQLIDQGLLCSLIANSLSCRETSIVPKNFTLCEKLLHVKCLKYTGKINKDKQTTDKYKTMSIPCVLI